MRIYRSREFKQIRVAFTEDKSVIETYMPSEGIADKEALFESARQENRDEYSTVTTEGALEIGLGEPERELKFVSGNGQTRSYSGRVEIKKKDDQSYAVLQEDAAVLEFPLSFPEVEAAAFQPGLDCKITVQNRVPHDLSAPAVWVGKREHADARDMLGDAHTQLQTLIAIENGGKRVYDRSFCAVHERSMELRNVGVAFGMLGFSASERYCQDHFPHYRDFGIGGCVMSEGDENKTIPIYICPDCVAACNEYKTKHAEPPHGN